MDFVENTADVNDGGSTNQRYLNSVKQELFKDFTEAVERLSSSMDRHLNDVFDELQSRTTSTHEILNKLGISRVFEQQDAAEYYEKILTQTSREASQIFHGELTHTTICHNPRCGANKSTSSHFWHLPLALMDSYSEEYRVVNGIEDYFRDSHFSGLDQMYCEDCDGKVDATVKCEVKHHPEVLVLLLKRFDFDYRYMSYVKNNRSVIIPFTLHIPETQAYELYAVVDHVGDLRYGHYAATIRSEDDGRWYNFNDSSVSLLGYQPFQLDHTERSPNAYLLFYRKQTNVTQNGRQSSRFLSVEYHGLFNQGATCYLNSLLQVLFMTREFREAVNRYILNLRGLCDDLHRHTVDTCSIILTLGINRVYEPQEAAEYVQRVLAPSFHQASQIHGRSTQTRCSKCQTGRSTESTVWHLPLTLMDSNSEEYCVVDGLKQCLTDQVSCERCGCKIDVITKYEVNHHPEVLVLLLKRFDFDSSNMTYVRNNRSVKLPRTLHISESQTYELYAAVDHVGDLRDGHHAAIIKSQSDDRWCNFVNNTYALPFQDKDTETSHTAHLLFYRRQKPADPCSEDTREVVTCEGSLPATSDTYTQSPDAETVTHREEEEESVEKGDDTAETVSTGENEEAQNRNIELVEPEAHVSCVEDQDRGADVKQLEPHSEELSYGNKPDAQEIMRHDDDDNVIRNEETDDLTDETVAISKETRTEKRENDQDGKDADDDKTRSNQDLNPGLCDFIRHPLPEQYELNKDQMRVMGVRTDKDEQTVSDEQSENLNTEHQVSEGTDDVRLKAGQHIHPVCMDNRDFTEEKATDNESEVVTCEGSLPATSDTYHQSPDAETVTHREEEEESVEKSDDTAETVSTGENEEAQNRNIEPVEPEAHVSCVEDQDRGADVKQLEPQNEELSYGNKPDAQETMKHDDDNMSRNEETDDLTDITVAITKETRTEEREDDQDGKDADDDKTRSNQDLNPGLSHLPEQYEMSKDQMRVMGVRTDKDEQTISDEQSENLNTEHQVSEGTDDVRLKAGQHIHPVCMDNRDFTEEKATDNESEPESGYDHHKPTEDSWDKTHKAEERHENDAQERESRVKLDRDGVNDQSSRKTKNRDEGEVQPKKKQKRGDDGEAGVAPQNNSNHNNKSQTEISDNQNKGSGKKIENVHSEITEHVFLRQRSADGRRRVENNDRDAQRSSSSVKGDVTRSKTQSQQHIITHQTKKTRTEGAEETSHGSNNRRTQNEIKSDLKTETLLKSVHSLNLKEAPAPETDKKSRRDPGKSEENEAHLTYLNEEKTQNIPDVQTESAGLEQPGKQRSVRRGKCWRFMKKEKKKRTNKMDEFQGQEKARGHIENDDSDSSDAEPLFSCVKGNVLESRGQSEKQGGKRSKCHTSHGSKTQKAKQSHEQRSENRGTWSKVGNFMKRKRKVGNVQSQNSEDDVHELEDSVGGRGRRENNDSKKPGKAITCCWCCVCSE